MKAPSPPTENVVLETMVCVGETVTTTGGVPTRGVATGGVVTGSVGIIVTPGGDVTVMGVGLVTVVTGVGIVTVFTVLTADGMVDAVVLMSGTAKGMVTLDTGKGSNPRL